MKRYETASGAVYLVDELKHRFKRVGPERFQVPGGAPLEVHPDGVWNSYKAFDIVPDGIVDPARGRERYQLVFFYGDGTARYTTYVINVKEVGSDE